MFGFVAIRFNLMAEKLRLRESQRKPKAHTMDQSTYSKGEEWLVSFGPRFCWFCLVFAPGRRKRRHRRGLRAVPETQEVDSSEPWTCSALWVPLFFGAPSKGNHEEKPPFGGSPKERHTPFFPKSIFASNMETRQRVPFLEETSLPTPSPGSSEREVPHFPTKIREFFRGSGS